MRFLVLAALLGLGLAFGCIPIGRTVYDVTSVQALAVDPVDPNTVLAIHGARIERSTDGARTWKVDQRNEVSALAWVGSRVWALGEPVGGTQLTLLVSADTGLTWSATVSPLPSTASSAFGSALAVDRTDDQHVVVGFSGLTPLVLVTRDAGATWSTASLAAVPSDTSPITLAFDGANGSSVWLGLPRVLLHSGDGGLTFAGTAAVISGAVLDIAALGSSVFVTTDSGLLASTDGGTTFTSRSLGSDVALGVRIDPAPSIVWVVGYSGVHRSTDGGATFLLVSNGFTTESSIAIAPSDDRIVYFGGVSTSDLGTTFVRSGAFDYPVVVPIY